MKKLDMTFSTDSEQGAGDTFWVELYDQYGAEITGNIEDPLIFTGTSSGNKLFLCSICRWIPTGKGPIYGSTEEGHINISFSEKPRAIFWRK